MAVLAFKIEAEWEKVQRLRTEIDQLKERMRSMGVDKHSSEFLTLNMRLADATKEYNQLVEAAGAAGAAMSSLTAEAAKLSGLVLGANTLKGFITKLYEVRSAFQDIESSMEVFLGSKEKADRFTKELQDYAYYNMFEFRDLANASKQLIAYKNDLNSVIPTIDKLSNIASGTQANLMDLVSMFNNAKNIGHIGSQQLAMWASRGVVVKDILKEMGEEVKGTTVTFEQLNKALDHVTSEGGMFHDLMQNQMENLSASVGQFQDDLDAMYNEIGTKLQDVIKWGIDQADSLVANYEEIGRALGYLILVYGEYRAALIATNAVRSMLQKATTASEVRSIDELIASLKAVLPAKEAVISEDLKAAVAKKQLTQEQAEEIQKRRENIDAMLDEAVASKSLTQDQADEIRRHYETLDALMIEAQARQQSLQEDLTEAMADESDAKLMLDYMNEYDAKAKENLQTAREAKELADERVQTLQDELDAISQVAYESDSYNDTKRELATAITEQESAAIALNTAEHEANIAAQDVSIATTEAEVAAKRTSTIQEELNSVSIQANTAAEGANAIATEGATAATMKQTISQKMGTAANLIFGKSIEVVTGAWNKMKAAMLANPLGAILVGITTLLPLIQSALSYFGILGDEEEKTSEISEQFGNSTAEVRNEMKKLQLIVNNTAADSSVHKKALNDLNNISKQYGITIDAEAESRGELNDKIEETIRLREEEAVAIAYANSVDSSEKNYNTESRKNVDAFAKEISDIDGADAITQYAKTFAMEEESLQRLSAAYEYWQRMKEEQGATAYDTMNAEKGYNELKKKMSAEFADQVAKELELTETQRITVLNAMKDMIESQRDDYDSKQANIEAAEKLARAEIMAKAGIEDYSEAADKSAWYSKVMELGAEKAAIVLQSIVDGFDGKEIKMWLTMDTSKIPAEILNMTKEQLQKRVTELNSPVVSGFMDPKKREEELGQVMAALYTKENGVTVVGGNTDETRAQAIARNQKIVKEKKAHQQTKGITAEQYKDDQKEIDQANKELRTLGVNTKGKKGGKGKKKDTTEKDHAKQVETLKKIAEERKEMQTQLEFDTAQAAIDAMKDGSAKTLRQLDLDKKKELDKLKKNYDDIRKKKIDFARRAFEADPKNKDKAFTYDENDARFAYTAEEEALYKQQQQNVIDSHRDAVAEQLKSDRQYMLDYLKEYGTLQEQRLAIVEDYERKIAEVRESSDSAEVKGAKIAALMKERDKETSAINVRQLTADIDWGTAFNGVGMVLGDLAKETLDKLDAYMKTSEFKGLGADEKKSYYDMRSKLREESGGNVANPFNLNVWGEIEEATNLYRDAVRDFNAASERHTEAVAEYEKAVEEEKNANSPQAKVAARTMRIMAENKVKETGEEMNTKKEAKDTAQQDLQDKTEAAINGLNNFSNALNELNDGSLHGFVNGITKIVTGMKGEAKGLEALGKAGGIVGAILSLIDSLGDAPAEFIEGLLNKVSDALFQVLSQLPDILGSVISGVFGSGGIFASIFSGIGSWFSGSNARYIAKQTEKLTDTNERLRTSIDSLTGKIDESAGGKAIEIYNKARVAQERYEQNLNRILQLQMSEYGKHHSNASKWNLSSADYAEISRIVGRDITSLSAIYSLSAAEMAEIRANASDVWGRMTEQGDYDKAEYWNEYADQGEALKDISEQIKENLTQTSFDSLRSSFLDTLMDMDADASAWSNNFTEMMQRALLNATLGDEFDKGMRDWYDNWANVMEKQGGDLTAEQIDKYKAEWQDFLQRGLERRDQIAQLTGYTGSDSEGNASFKSANNFTQEQGDVLNGRLAAIQIAGEQRNTQLTLLNATAEDLRNINTDVRDISNDIRDYAVRTYLELVEINGHQSVIERGVNDMVQRVANIEQNIVSKL